MALASLKWAWLFFFNYFRFFLKKIMYFIINVYSILIGNKRRCDQFQNVLIMIMCARFHLVGIYPKQIMRWEALNSKKKQIIRWVGKSQSKISHIYSAITLKKSQKEETAESNDHFECKIDFWKDGSVRDRPVSSIRIYLGNNQIRPTQ